MGDGMFGLVWEDPPPPAGSSGTQARVALLKAYPGVWARWPAKTSPNTLRKHGLEALQRSIDGKTVIYVRWPADAHTVTVDPIAQTRQEFAAAVAIAAPARAPSGRPRLAVLACREDGCGFETLRDQRRKMLAHVFDNHGREATTVELTPMQRGIDGVHVR